MLGRNISQSLKVLLGGTLAGVLLRALHATLRWDRISMAPSDLPWRNDKQKLLVFWHGRILVVPMQRVRRALGPTGKMFCLISEHTDGQIISRAAKSFGIDTVAGSSTRGGMRALYEMMFRANEGSCVVITPDGPKGPPHQCKSGVAIVAQRRALPVYPLAFSVKSYWEVRSWDRMRIPKPFSRAVMLVGGPLLVGPEEGIEDARVRIEVCLNELTQKADAFWTTGESL